MGQLTSAAAGRLPTRVERDGQGSHVATKRGPQDGGRWLLPRKRGGIHRNVGIYEEVFEEFYTEIPWLVGLFGFIGLLLRIYLGLLASFLALSCGFIGLIIRVLAWPTWLYWGL